MHRFRCSVRASGDALNLWGGKCSIPGRVCLGATMNDHERGKVIMFLHGNMIRNMKG